MTPARAVHGDGKPAGHGRVQDQFGGSARRNAQLQIETMNVQVDLPVARPSQSERVSDGDADRPCAVRETTLLEPKRDVPLRGGRGGVEGEGRDRGVGDHSANSHGGRTPGVAAILLIPNPWIP